MTQGQLQKLTNKDFDQLRSDIMTEQVRRNRLREIPDEIAALGKQFEEVGGSTDELVTRLNEPTGPQGI